MNSNIVLIVLGEPNSTFSELLFKYFRSKNFKKNIQTIVLIGNVKLFKEQMKKLKYKFFINEIDDIKKSKRKTINIINVDYKFKKVFSRISSSSNKYIENSFNKALELLKLNKLNKLINGPISKKHFLKRKFPGITEYISSKTKTKNEVMLIYNKNLAVTPLTTHIPIKNVTQNIKKKKIINTAIKINNFYSLYLKKKPNIAVLGLNPHCETIAKKSEEKNIISPAIKYLIKNKIKIFGPFSADTFFLKKILKNLM